MHTSLQIYTIYKYIWFFSLMYFEVFKNIFWWAIFQERAPDSGELGPSFGFLDLRCSQQQEIVWIFQAKEVAAGSSTWEAGHLPTRSLTRSLARSLCIIPSFCCCYLLRWTHSDTEQKPDYKELAVIF